MASHELVASSEHLDQALATLHQASLDFVTPDAQARARGEATFLALRQSERALQYACYALQHSNDAIALFQSLNALIYVLPSLVATTTTTTTNNINNNPSDTASPSLPQLRDFLLDFCTSRALHAARTNAQASTSTSTSANANANANANTSLWPQYLRARAYQTAIAVEKRLLGLELAHCANNHDAAAAQAVVHAHVDRLASHLADLLRSLPSYWPTDPLESATVLANLGVGLGLVKSLVDEFVMTPPNDASAPDPKKPSKAKVAEPGTPVGLSLQEHRWCKAVVQNYLLEMLAGHTFELLYAIISAKSDPGVAWRMSLFPQMVAAVEKLLGWTFLLSDPFADFGTDANQDQVLDADDEGAAAGSNDATAGGRRYIHIRKLPSQFVRILYHADVVTLLSNAYRFALAASATAQNRDLSFSVHRLRQCLLLAASFVPSDLVHGQVSTEAVVSRLRHLCATLQSLVQEECSGPTSALLSARGNALLFLAQAYQSAIDANPVGLLAEALRSGEQDAAGTIAFLSSLSQLGKSIFGLAFHRARDTDEEDDLAVLAEDTTDTLLGCWQVLLSALYREAEAAGGKQPSPQLQMLWQAVHGSIRDEVFRPYVTGRLQAAAMPAEDDMSEHDEAAAKDRDVYSDQLITIAGLGRLSASDNLRALLELAQPLCQRLSAVAQGQAAAEPQELEKVWEQMHWLLLIVGHLLADEAKGETPEIPLAIASSQEPEDPAVATIMELGLNLVQTLSSHGAQSAQATSPQVTETLLWFVGRWTATYLLIDDHSGFPTNAAIQRALSGEAGRKVLALLLQRLRENVELWMSDSDVLVQIAAALSSFTRSSGIMLHLLQLPEMESLVLTIVSGLDALPASTHGPLVSAVVSCIYSGASYVGQETGRTAEFYFQQITGSIEGRFGSLLQRADFASIAQRSDVIAAVQTSLDMLDGLAASVQPNSADAVYAFLSKFFPAFSHLCRVYETRTEVALSVVKVLHTLAVALELDFGAEPYMVSGLNAVTRQVLEALKGKTQHSLMVRDGGSPLEDEVPYEGLCLAIELLNELTGSARAGNDESALGPSTLSDATLSPTRTADVALYGFESLVVLLDAEPLGVQRVRRGLAKLISSILSLFSDRLVGITLAAEGAGGGPLQNTVTALTLIFTLDEADCVSNALEALTPFSRAVIKALVRPPVPPAANVAISDALDRLITSLLRLLLLEPLDSSLVESVLIAVRSLIMARTHASLPGGLEGLFSTLQTFVTSAPLVSLSSAGSAPTSSAPSFLTADEATRRQTLFTAVQSLVQDCLGSLRSVMEDAVVRPPWLSEQEGDLSAARTWGKIERDQLTAFVARWKGEVNRVRSRVRVR
ncbi:hypothetical protein ACQY0O_001401 [Thecaphora frezii]